MGIFKKKRLTKDENEYDSLVRMSLVDHLSEFRKRLIVVVVCFFVSTMVCFNFVQFFVDKLIELGEGYNFVYIAPSELIMQYVKVSVLAGVVFTSPVILYELWRFICPGLKIREKLTIFFALLSGLLFFCLGSAFAFTIMIPIMLQFFLKVDVTQTIKSMISFANYISFVTTTLLMFGLVFELPVITMVLAQLGLLKPEWLTKSRGVIVIIIFLVAALITPPDIVSQILIAIPMLGLFEISVLLCKILVFRKRKRKEKLDLL